MQARSSRDHKLQTLPIIRRPRPAQLGPDQPARDSPRLPSPNRAGLDQTSQAQPILALARPWQPQNYKQQTTTAKHKPRTTNHETTTSRPLIQRRGFECAGYAGTGRGHDVGMSTLRRTSFKLQQWQTLMHIVIPSGRRHEGIEQYATISLQYAASLHKGVSVRIFCAREELAHWSQELRRLCSSAASCVRIR